MSRTNRTYDEIQVGESGSVTRVCTADDFIIFAHATGNLNPIHLPEVAGENAVAPGMYVGSLFSAVIGNVLPGVGSIYQSQTLRFHRRVKVGEELTAKLTVIEKGKDRLVTFDCKLTNERGDLISDGIGTVTAPDQKITMEDTRLGPLVIKKHEKYHNLLAKARSLGATPTAVAYPCDEVSLRGPIEAAEQGLIEPILIGPADKIQALAAQFHLSIERYRLVPVATPHAAASKAVELVHAGEAKMVMKGSLHSDELLHEVIKSQGGLRTGRRISHTFVLDVPGLERPLFVSDAALNIAPDLMTKVDITQNAIDLAQALGNPNPKVAILCAVETVNPAMPATLEAAALSKMAERGQIKGGIVDGPLAMDNAINVEAARTKGINSLVAGNADVLIVPNIESGNMVVKELTFLAHADAAGVVVGALVPVVLTSRADNVVARLASCASAALYGYFRKTGKPWMG